MRFASAIKNWESGLRLSKNVNAEQLIKSSSNGLKRDDAWLMRPQAQLAIFEVSSITQMAVHRSQRRNFHQLTTAATSAYSTPT